MNDLAKRARAPRRTLFLALALLTTAPALAVGFGAATTRTGLGQRLDFVAPMMFEPGEDASVSCLAAEVRAGENRIAPGNVHAVLEGPVGAPRRVRVTTAVSIQEPIVSVEISIGCDSKISKRFVSFIDPPEVTLARIEPDGAPSTPPAASPRVATAAERQAVRRAPRAGSRSVASRKPATRLASASTARSATRGPRLQLEARSPPAAPVAPPVAAAAALLETVDASTVAAAEASRLQQERTLLLEAEMARLRSDAQTTRQTVATLQARLREAESTRHANVVVYVLTGTAAFFALLALALWLLRPRQRRRAAWFDAKDARAGSSTAVNPAVHGDGDEAERHSESAPSISQPSPWHVGSQGLPLNTTPASIGGLEVTTVIAPSAAREAFTMVSGASATTPSRGELSMEALIDLEQQAEFFVVLGQEEAAIALLEDYVDSDGQSPLPYLQLLELQRKRSDPTAYELVRDAFASRFDAVAPPWSAEPGVGRSLDAYPQALARIQALWPTPLSAMDALDSMLLRRHASDEAFDFPACRELLFLYSIARELAGHVETDFGAIDLFLPLDDAQPGRNTPEPTGNTIDFDVSGWTEDDPVAAVQMQRAG